MEFIFSCMIIPCLLKPEAYTVLGCLRTILRTYECLLLLTNEPSNELVYKRSLHVYILTGGLTLNIWTIYIVYIIKE